MKKQHPQQCKQQPPARNGVINFIFSNGNFCDLGQLVFCCADLVSYNLFIMPNKTNAIKNPTILTKTNILKIRKVISYLNKINLNIVT